MLLSTHSGSVATHSLTTTCSRTIRVASRQALYPPSREHAPYGCSMTSMSFARWSIFPSPLPPFGNYNNSTSSATSRVVCLKITSYSSYLLITYLEYHTKLQSVQLQNEINNLQWKQYIFALNTVASVYAASTSCTHEAWPSGN